MPGGDTYRSKRYLYVSESKIYPGTYSNTTCTNWTACISSVSILITSPQRIISQSHNFEVVHIIQIWRIDLFLLHTKVQWGYRVRGSLSMGIWCLNNDLKSLRLYWPIPQCSRPWEEAVSVQHTSQQWNKKGRDLVRYNERNMGRLSCDN